MNISNDLASNILLDWKKRLVSPIEKSDFVKGLLEEQGISIHELSRRSGISYSTLQDWVSMRQVKNNLFIMDSVKSKNSIYTLADRLMFLLSKNNDIDDKTREKLRLLQVELFKISN